MTLTSPGLPAPAAGAVHIPGFQLETVWSGLSNPTALAFAPNGRVFVAERSGLIKTFASVTDTSSEVAADLRTEVHSVADRGLLGLAVDPDFPANPYIYVSYIRDAPPGGNSPFYGDACPNSPTTGAKDGCPATGRISRITVNAQGHMIGSPLTLIGDTFYCHQHQAHALDHLAFGPDGALYASAGEGGSATFVDWGQHSGDPLGAAPNACGDPPVPAGTPLSLPTTEGGSLRSQDIRTLSDPSGGSGAIIRIDPATGDALPDNPLVGGNPGDDRHVAYGLRNPFRFTFRPGTDEIWVADVGWHTWEELNRIPDPTQAPRNFGWPCYEGSPRQPQWDSLNVNLCETLYQAGPGAVTGPYWSYRHNQSPDPASCGSAGSAMSALAFAAGPPYPVAYDGALFVGDYTKRCLWVLQAGANGLPDPATVETLASDVFPVDLDAGPGGYLYMVDIGLGQVDRITFFSDNEPPIARATATPQLGPTPLQVSFNGSASTDADGPFPLSYAWDLDGDGAFDDATAVNASRTYTASSNVTVRLRVTDGSGASGVTTVLVQPGNTPPQVTIVSPSSGARWSAGDRITFSGTASDPQDGSLSSDIAWSVVLHHCAVVNDCHEHPQIERVGASGSFDAPEHEYPAFLELRASVTDSRGATREVTLALEPVVGDLTFLSNPIGLQLLAGSHQGATPFTVTAISGSRVSISAPPSPSAGGETYEYDSWSDGGARNHEVVTTSSGRTLTAIYQGDFTRRAGPNRYATAAAISQAAFNPGVPVVYVANGLTFPDALGAGPAASQGNGPVLLVGPSSIPAETAAELDRLNPQQIVIAGGTAVVSSAVEQALQQYAPTITRRAGPNRYATAAAISQAAFNPGVPVVYVANGLTFPDALGAGPAASQGNGPVLLVGPSSIPAETAAELDRLNPQQIVIAGGTAVVSSAVEQALQQFAPTITRRAGPNRYATAAAISQAAFNPGVPVVYVANGLTFPDALGAGPAASQGNGPVLLVGPSSIPAETAAELDRLNPQQIVIAGGTAVVSSAVEQALQQYAPGG